MNTRAIFFLLLLVVQVIPSVVEGKGLRETRTRKLKKQSSMLKDIAYTTAGAACLAGAYIAGTFAKERYDALSLLWQCTAEEISTKTGPAKGHIDRWYTWEPATTKRGKIMVAGEVLGLSLLVGILGSTGVQCVLKGLHITTED